MKIGIIGAGNIGGTLARRLTALGHDVSIANSRGPATLAGLAERDRCQAGDGRPGRSLRGGGDRGHPGQEHPSPAARPVRRRRPTTWSWWTPATTTRSSATAGSTPSRTAPPRAAGCRSARRPVIKAFNNIYAQHLLERGQPGGRPAASPCPWRATTGGQGLVFRLLDELGFDGVDAGAWTSRGGNSPEHRSTAPTSTRRACGGHWRRLRRSGNRCSAQLRATRHRPAAPDRAATASRDRGYRAPAACISCAKYSGRRVENSPYQEARISGV